MNEDWGNDPVAQEEDWGNDPVASLPVKWVAPTRSGAVPENFDLLNSTSVGRVLDAFGEGAGQVYEERLGLSLESEKELRDRKFFMSPDLPAWQQPTRAFNEGLIRPLAGGVDALLRLFPAVVKGGAYAAGQVGEELGLLDPKNTNLADPASKQRFIDSVDEAIQVGSIVAGGEATYMGTRINVPKSQKALKSFKDVVKDPPVKKSITDQNFGLGERPTLQLPPAQNNPVVKSDTTNFKLNELAYERGKDQLMAPYKDIEESFDAALEATKNMPALNSKLQTIKTLFNSANDDHKAVFNAFEEAVQAIDFAADNGVKLPDEVFKLQNAMDELTSPLPDVIMAESRKVVDKEYAHELHQLETEPVLDNIVFRINQHEEAVRGELPEDFLMNDYQQLAMGDFLTAKGWNKDDLMQRYTNWRQQADVWSEEYGYRSISDELLKTVTDQIEAAPKVAGPKKNPTDMRAAIRLGPDEIYVGNVGETHAEVFNRVLQEKGMEFADRVDALDTDATIKAYGFYDNVDKKFLTDKEALQAHKEFGMRPPESRAATRFLSPEVVAQHERYRRNPTPTASSDITLKFATEEDLVDFGEAAGFRSGENQAITREQADKLLAEKERRAKAATNAAPLPPTPQGISPKYVKSDGTFDTTQLHDAQAVQEAIAELAVNRADNLGPELTRGEISWAQTESLAQTAGVLPHELLQRKIGDAWNAEQVESAKLLLEQGAREVLEAGRKARATGSDADMLAWVEAYQRASLYNEQVTGIKAEAGRALNILRKHKEESVEMQNLSQVLKELGGNASMEDILEALKALDNADAGAVNGFINAVNKVGPTDMLLEYVYNAMLSSPVTHMANIVGNTLAALWEVPVAGLTGVFGEARALMGSRTAIAGDRAFVGEAAARLKGMVQPLLPDIAQIKRGAAEEKVLAKLYGMMQGAPEGLRLAWRAIKEERPSSGASKIENGKTRAIPGPIGRAIRVPTTALMAEDEVFQAMGYRASINAQAYAKAAKEGLTGQRFKDRVAKLTLNPTKKMVEKAHEEAAYVTFTTELGKTGKSVQRLLSNHPILKVVVAPFFRTPVNLLKHPIAHSPLSLASKETINVLAGKKGARARDEAYARMLLGSGVITGAFVAASAGKLTGAGPKDPAERAMWQLAGNQPYSFRVGDTWYSYARLEPFATLLGVAADAAYISNKLDTDESASIGTLLTYSAGQNVLNKTWLKGVTDIVEAINEPERYGDAYLRNLATRVVPAAVGQAARMDDPYLRDVRTMVDAFKNKYGDSESIYPKRDIFGNAIKREGAFGPDIVSPMFITNVNNDPVIQELMALQVFPGKVDREIRGVELNEKQYDEYQIAAGRLLYQAYSNLIKMPGWQDIPSGMRQEILAKQLSNTREQARTYMLFKNPDILQTSMKNKYDQLSGQK